MQNLIKETGLTNKEFAEYYGIPYNTVLQWSKGIRQAPEYLINLIRENRELKTNGVQLNISTGKIYDVLEKAMYTQTTWEIYEENDCNFHAQTKFWKEQEEKGGRYPPKIRTFKVQEIL